VTGMAIAKLPSGHLPCKSGYWCSLFWPAKNAILIVEYARQLHEEGKNARDAATEASAHPLPPDHHDVAIAFIFGVTPLVLGHGGRAEMRRSLGRRSFRGNDRRPPYSAFS